MSQLKLSTSAWSTQTAFILAAVGSAVGLGNLWKFPYIVGENGGGAFVLVYLGCVLLLGLPVLLSEITLGRRGRASPPQAMANLAKESDVSRAWWWLGLNGLIAGLLILSFYSVIAGWAFSYFLESLTGGFQTKDTSQVSGYFSTLVSSPWTLLLWHTVVTGLTVWIVSKGVKSGLEKAIFIMMPGLMIILLILFGYAASKPEFFKSLAFLFEPDFSKLTTESILVAMGHAFFTLSIGMGAMMVYGSYFSQRHSILKAGLWIVFFDTAVALLAGVVIFTVVFGNHLEPSAGPGLLFQTLPLAFANMSGGWFFGTLFFALVILAALSSAISLIEPSVSWMEQNWNIARSKSTWGIGIAAWVLGIGTVLSFNVWQGVHLMGERTIFETLDFITTNIMLPLGGLLMAVFMGWFMKRSAVLDELRMPVRFQSIFFFVLKFITPVLVLAVFVNNLG